MILLPTRAVEKPWGKDVLPAPFTSGPGQRIGEIWFEPPAEMDGLLVKYIFTSERLSVQVHPSDAQTIAAGLGRQGKEECWLVIDAEPGAKLGVGLREPLAGDRLLAAALDGSIEHLLEWHPISAGDFFYIPANTVHAIGQGISLIEVQQNSDITYRLFDYGRPRELHLDQGIAVSNGKPHPAEFRRKIEPHGNTTLVDGPLFLLDRVDGPISAKLHQRYDGALLVVPISDGVTVTDVGVPPGSCALATGIGQVCIQPGALALLAATTRT